MIKVLLLTFDAALLGDDCDKHHSQPEQNLAKGQMNNDLIFLMRTKKTKAIERDRHL